MARELLIDEEESERLIVSNNDIKNKFIPFYPNFLKNMKLVKTGPLKDIAVDLDLGSYEAVDGVPEIVEYNKEFYIMWPRSGV